MQSGNLPLPDGATLAFDIVGTSHLGKIQPIVLVGGLSSRRGDWARLAERLAMRRPVLLFDHRGIGDSTFSKHDEKLTVESMARDLLYLIASMKWESVAICSFSMGGVITQQLMFLPFQLENPTPLPFQITHVFLTGTFPRRIEDKKYGLPFAKVPPGKKLTEEEKRNLARPVLETSFDPKWCLDPANTERFEWWLSRMTQKRPMTTIRKQVKAVSTFKFDQNLYEKLPRDTKILVLHGELDAVVPFYMGQELVQRIPRAKFVQVGNHPGQVPSLAFGHHWFEYFDIEVWYDVIEKFMTSVSAQL